MNSTISIVLKLLIFIISFNKVAAQTPKTQISNYEYEQNILISEDFGGLFKYLYEYDKNLNRYRYFLLEEAVDLEISSATIQGEAVVGTGVTQKQSCPSDWQITVFNKGESEFNGKLQLLLIQEDGHRLIIDDFPNDDSQGEHPGSSGKEGLVSIPAQDSVQLNFYKLELVSDPANYTVQLEVRPLGSDGPGSEKVVTVLEGENWPKSLPFTITEPGSCEEIADESCTEEQKIADFCPATPYYIGDATRQEQMVLTLFKQEIGGVGNINVDYSPAQEDLGIVFSSTDGSSIYSPIAGEVAGLNISSGIVYLYSTEFDFTFALVGLDNINVSFGQTIAVGEAVGRSREALYVELQKGKELTLVGTTKQVEKSFDPNIVLNFYPISKNQGGEGIKIIGYSVQTGEKSTVAPVTLEQYCSIGVSVQVENTYSYAVSGKFQATLVWPDGKRYIIDDIPNNPADGVEPGTDNGIGVVTLPANSTTTLEFFKDKLISGPANNGASEGYQIIIEQRANIGLPEGGRYADIDAVALSTTGYPNPITPVNIRYGEPCFTEILDLEDGQIPFALKEGDPMNLTWRYFQLDVPPPSPGRVSNAVKKGKSSFTKNTNASTFRTSDSAPVDIYFSSDGGQSFDLRLATGVTDTFYTATVPNVDTQQGRVKIQLQDDPDVYDISNINLAVQTQSTERTEGGEDCTTGADINICKVESWPTCNAKLDGTSDIFYLHFNTSLPSGVYPLPQNYQVLLGGRTVESNYDGDKFIVTIPKDKPAGVYNVQIRAVPEPNDDDYTTVTSVATSVTIYQPTDVTVIGPTEICSDDGDAGCLEISVTDANSIQWYRDGQPIANATTFRYCPVQSGNYKVIIEDKNGCEAESPSVSVDYNEAPTASFEFADNLVCVEQPVTIINNSTIPNGGSIAYEISMGDGTTYTTPNPSHLYESPGLYTVTMKVKNADDGGCVDEMPLVVEVVAKPDNTFTVVGPRTFCAKDIGVTYLQAPDGVGVQWFKGENAIPEAEGGNNPKLEVKESGIYSLETTAFGFDGKAICSNLSEQTEEIIVNPSPISASIGADLRDVCPFTPISFTSSVSTEQLGGSSSLVYNWDFGDGNSSNEANPTHLYNSPSGSSDPYIVQLEVSIGGCAVLSQEIPIQVNPIPPANITLNGNLGVCAFDRFNTTLEANEGNGYTYEWFVDGASTGKTTRIINPEVSGNYTVLVSRNDGKGVPCDSLSAPQRVDFFASPDPTTVNFTFDKNRICQGESIQFTDQTNFLFLKSDDNITYEWDFGDGTATSSEKNPSHVFDTPKEDGYTVTMRVSVNGNCEQVVSRKIEVLPNPVVQLTNVGLSGRTKICEKDIPSVYLQALYDENYSYIWFIDNNQVENPNNSNTFNEFELGVHNYYYEARVRGTNCVVTSDSIELEVIPSPIIKAINVIDNKDQLCIGEPLTLDVDIDFAEGLGYESSVIIEFGDVAGTTTANSQATFSYSTPGPKEIIVTVLVDNFCFEVERRRVDVYERPAGELLAETTVASGLTSLVYCSDEEAYLKATPVIGARYEWLRNGVLQSGIDGNTVTNPASGTWQVLVKHAGTECDSLWSSVEVIRNEAPSPALSIADNSICLGESISLTNETAVADNAAISYRVSMNGEDVFDYFPTSYEFQTPGTKVIEVYASANGCSERVVRDTVQVNALPDRDILVNGLLEHCEDESPTTLTADLLDNQAGEWYRDGQPTGLTTRSITLSSPEESGVYTFEVTNTATTCRSVLTGPEVKIYAAPVPVITASATRICAENPPAITFDASESQIDLAEGMQAQYFWYFGNGQTSSSPQPSMTYAQAGTYEVVLQLTIDDRCPRYGTMQIEVVPPPAANEALVVDGDLSYCSDIEDPPTIIAPMVEGVVYRWYKDGVLQEAYQGNTVEEPASGVWTVEMAYSDQLACSRTLPAVTIQRNEAPSPNFQLNKLRLCFGESLLLTDLTNVADGSSAELTLDMNGEDLFTNTELPEGEEFEYVFRSIGTKTITLTATANGCTRTYSQTIEVVRPPELGYTVSNPSLLTRCSNQEAPTITAQGLDNASLCDNCKVEWLIDDEVVGNNQSILAEVEGQYRIRVTDITTGCSTTIDGPKIVVYEAPTPLFTTNVTADDGASTECFNTAIQFINQTDIDASANAAANYLWDFGDGSPLVNDENPNHTYQEAGTYTATLTVDIDGRCPETYERIIEIIPRPTGELIAVGPATYCTGDADLPSLQAPFYENATYRWYLNGVLVPAFKNYIIESPESGLWKVEIELFSSKCTEVFGPVEIQRNISPTPAFSFSQSSICFGEDIVLFEESSVSNGSSIDLQIEVEGEVFTREDLVDGKLTYTPKEAGTKEVTLTATANSCTRSITKSFTVNEAPSANIAISDPDKLVRCNDEAPVVLRAVGLENESLCADCVVEWQLDGETISKQREIQAVEPGEYSLQVLDRNTGCSRLVIGPTVKLLYAPDPIFSLSTVAADGGFSACEEESINFANQTQIDAPEGTAVSWDWDFGDGSSGSALENPVYDYGEAGTYTVTLTVRVEGACPRTHTETVTIVEKPMGTLEVIGDATYCSIDPVPSVLEGPFYEDATYRWYLNGVLQSQYQSHRVDAPETGEWTLQVQLQNTTCANDFGPINITRVVAPTPKLSFNALTLCVGDTLTVTNESTFGAGQTPSYILEINGQRYPFENSRTQLYSSTQVDTVKLFMDLEEGGCATQVFSQAIEVVELPEAVIDYDKSFGESPTLCSQDIGELALSAPTGYLYQWSRNGVPIQLSEDSDAQNRVFTPKRTGSYTVTLTHPNSDCQNTSSAVAVTIGQAPTLTAVTSEIEVCQGSEATLEAAVTLPDEATLVLFETGDGNVSRPDIIDGKVSMSHSYKDVGTYIPSLIVETITGCSDTLSMSVIVKPNPIADAVVDNHCFGETIPIENTSASNGAGTIISYNWDFGDGNTSTLREPEYDYAQPGTYPVKLEVEAVNGCVDTYTTEVVVADKPEALFELKSITCGSKAVTLENTTQYDGSFATTWLWGDSSPAEEINTTEASHTYNIPGVYTVKMVVTPIPDGSNAFTVCPDTTEQVINVGRPPVAKMQLPNQVCAADSFSISNVSQTIGNNPINAIWNMGDGEVVTENSFEYAYPEAGEYTVTLVITDLKTGCQDTSSQSIEVLPANVADYDLAYECEPLKITLLDLSNELNPDPWQYIEIDWGDGEVSKRTTVENSHTYQEQGNYQIVYRVIGFNGCRSIPKTEIIRVEPLLQADFEASESCVGSETVFTSTSIVNSPSTEPGQGGYITSWSWTFGDGTSSDEENPTHVYNNSGVYNVSLTVEDNRGCVSTFDKQIQAFPPPSIEVSSAEQFICLNNIPDAISLTSEVSGDVEVVEWEFDPGLGNVVEAEGFEYALSINSGLEEGDYAITAKAISEFSCVAYDTLIISVYGEIEADLDIRNEYTCDDSVKITLDVNSNISSLEVLNLEATYQRDTLEANYSPFQFTVARPNGGVAYLEAVLTVAKDEQCSVTTVPATLELYPKGQIIIDKIAQEPESPIVNISHASTGVVQDLFEWSISEVVDQDGNTELLDEQMGDNLEYIFTPGKLYKVIAEVPDSMIYISSSNYGECLLHKSFPPLGDVESGDSGNGSGNNNGEVLSDTTGLSQDDSSDPIELPQDIPVMKVPNAFSPNNDELNDIFIPKFIENLPEITQYSFVIYRDDGSVVFGTNKISEGWDGKIGPNQELASQFEGYKYVIKIIWKGRKGQMFQYESGPCVIKP